MSTIITKQNSLYGDQNYLTGKNIAFWHSYILNLFSIDPSRLSRAHTAWLNALWDYTSATKVIYIKYNEGRKTNVILKSEGSINFLFSCVTGMLWSGLEPRLLVIWWAWIRQTLSVTQEGLLRRWIRVATWASQRDPNLREKSGWQAPGKKLAPLIPVRSF